MNYPRTVLDHDKLQDNQRVYVRDLDVFGRMQKREDVWTVNCEKPMLGFIYEIGPRTVLFNDAIGDRDPE